MLIPPQAALALATALAAAPQVPIPTQGGRETFALGHMQWRRHEIALEAGQFLQATIHQRGVDLKVRLVAPDGRTIEDAIDVSEGPSGREPASMLASAPGTYAIEIRASPYVEGAGHYELATDVPRRPTARDVRWLEAERMMATAGRFMGPRVGGSPRPRPSADQVIEAGNLFGAAAPLWAGLGEICWQAEASSGVAINLLWAGERESSLDVLGEAIDLWQTCGDEYKVTEAVVFASRAFVAASRFREAAEVCELGLAREEPIDPVQKLQFQVQLALIHGQLGDTEQALRYGELALPMLRERRFTQGTAVVLAHLANAHYRRGELQKASDLALEALPLQQELGDVLGLHATLLVLGDAYDALGEPEVALGYLQDAIDRLAEVGVTDETDARARVAAILRRLGRTESARAQGELALSRARALRDERGEMVARLQLAGILLDAGDRASARQHAEAALAMAGRSGDRFAAAEARELAGVIDLSRGDLVRARTELDAGLALRRSIGDRGGEATALYHRARVALAADDLDAARALLEEARAIVAAQRVLLAAPQLRATWSSTVRGIDEAYVDVLMSLHRRRPAGGFDVAAFEASESASARSLLDELAEPAVDAASALAERERKARLQLIEALDREARARIAGKPQPAVHAIARSVRELATAHDRVRAELRASDPRYAALMRPETLRLAAVQSRLLDAESTLVEFFLGQERGYAWVVGADRLQSYELPSRARIEAAVEEVRRALTAPPATGAKDRAPSALRALARLVLPPDRTLLRGTRLVVVADGALHHAPFAALPDASGRPLVERFEIASVPSASVAAALRRLQAGRTTAPRAIAVVADPVYDVGDARLPGADPVRVIDSTLAQATRDFDFQDGRLPRLPFTRREALSIAALAPALSTMALDFSANLETALSPDLAAYRYVHFAAHGLLNDARPELSGLVLSLVDRDGRTRPGLLTAPDVSALRLNADLVVLSSCRSAAGREVRGEGLVGLTRAFMYAGAPRVVASLWPVDDMASAELMTAMYRGMLGPSKLSPAAALRSAQRAMLRHRKWRDPYYWAGFQLQGEWR